MRFSHGPQRVQTWPGDETEIPGIGRKIGVNERPHQTVEQPGGESLGQRLTVTPQSLPVNDVVSLAVFGDHLEDDFGGILKIGIDDDDGIAAGGIQSGGHGGLVAEVVRQAEHFDSRVGRGPFHQQVQCPIGTAVVDEDHLHGTGQRVQKLVEPFPQDREDGLFVISGDDDAKKCGVATGL